jgi:hypothetical protein
MDNCYNSPNLVLPLATPGVSMVQNQNRRIMPVNLKQHPEICEAVTLMKCQAR